MGAMDPLWWHSWHRSCKIGATFLAKVTCLSVDPEPAALVSAAKAELDSMKKVANATIPAKRCKVICTPLHQSLNSLPSPKHDVKGQPHECTPLPAGHALVIPAERAPSGVHLTHIDITLGIRRDAVNVVELAHAMPAVPAEETQHLQVLAVHNIHLLVASIRHVE